MQDNTILVKLSKLIEKDIPLKKDLTWIDVGYECDVDNRVKKLSLNRSVNDQILGKAINLILGLEKLTHLFLANCNLTGIFWLGTLRQVSNLILRNNSIQNLYPIKDLNLSDLDVSNNNISRVPRFYYEKELIRLNLSNNQIDDIQFLANATNLVTLNLSKNNLTQYSVIKNLKKTIKISLQDNPIDEIPEWVLNYHLFVNWNEEDIQDGFIYFYNNPLLTPPLEIAKQGRENIQKWYNDEKVFYNEVKVIFVGNGEVGKTTLIKCLNGESPNPQEAPTHYVKITKQKYADKGKEVFLSFWDFGGQEVMHSTHQFFLSKRSIYVLVLDGRRDEDPEYWLKHIESLGGNSPVLIVLNKVDTNPRYDVNRNFLLEKYNFIVGFYKTSCFGTISGIEGLKNGLISAFENVEMLTTKWPKKWIPVKEELHSMKEDYISQTNYEEICRKHSVFQPNSQESLAEFLHDLGTVVHFKDLKLNELHILNPIWASRAAYKIVNSDYVVSKLGTLKLSDLNYVMNKEKEKDNELTSHNHINYSPSCFSFILELLQKFELCYYLQDNDEYLIPGLMNIQQPGDLPIQTGPVLCFIFRFDDILPESIITKFIVRMHEDIENEYQWRTGVVLYDKVFETRAIVIADKKEKYITVSVSGRQRIEHFSVIRKTIHDLKKSFEKLAMTEWIPLPDVPNFSIEYEELIGYEECGIEDIFVGRLKKSYKVRELLNGIEIENIRKKEFDYDVFICYSSKDTNIIKLILKDFKKLKVSYWIDYEKLNPSDNIIDAITDGLQKSRVIVPMISKNQLNSGWSRWEYQAILSKIIAGTTNHRIAPLILDDVDLESVPLFLKNIRIEKWQQKSEYKRFLTFLSKNRT